MDAAASWPDQMLFRKIMTALANISMVPPAMPPKGGKKAGAKGAKKAPGPVVPPPCDSSLALLELFAADGADLGHWIAV